jgi:hypothetical protein
LQRVFSSPLFWRENRIEQSLLQRVFSSPLFWCENRIVVQEKEGLDGLTTFFLSAIGIQLQQLPGSETWGKWGRFLVSSFLSCLRLCLFLDRLLPFVNFASLKQYIMVVEFTESSVSGIRYVSLCSNFLLQSNCSGSLVIHFPLSHLDLGSRFC